MIKGNIVRGKITLITSMDRDFRNFTITSNMVEGEFDNPLTSASIEAGQESDGSCGSGGKLPPTSDE